VWHSHTFDVEVGGGIISHSNILFLPLCQSFYSLIFLSIHQALQSARITGNQRRTVPVAIIYPETSRLTARHPSPSSLSQSHKIITDDKKDCHGQKNQPSQ